MAKRLTAKERRIRVALVFILIAFTAMILRPSDTAAPWTDPWGIVLLVAAAFAWIFVIIPTPIRKKRHA